MPSIKEIMETLDYGPAPESNTDVKRWLEDHSSGIGHFINGNFIEPAGSLTDVVNPADDSVIAKLAKGTQEDVDSAVKAARNAFSKWSTLAGHERAKYLYAIARHVQKRERFLSVLETMDNGKTIRETRDIDIPLVARHFYHHAGWAELVETEFPGYQAVGVCGQVIPWNFPLLMLAWKIAPALAAGNTVVLKPADLTPLTAHAFAEICSDVGLPAGVVNIVQGDGETGSLITGHNDVDKVAFTGSTAVGRMIRKQTAGSGKKLSLELGGKSPFIVFEDADLDAAVEGVVDAVWFNQGEVCCAGTRVIVQEGIADQFFGKLDTRLQKMRIGDPLDKTMDMGAIVSHTQLNRINALVKKGEDEGAVLHQLNAALPAAGSFCAPSFFTETEPANTLSETEIFGPIAVTMTFRTPSEALAIANHSRYGLSASIWSQNVDRAIEAAAKVKAGIVWINATNLFDAGAAFGGYRESGFGREGAREGLYEYLVATPFKKGKKRAVTPLDANVAPGSGKTTRPPIDITAKMYIGGKQLRADSGQSYNVIGKSGVIGQAALGSRKDVRNAVESAANATHWSGVTEHNRAQILYYLAENLSQRREEFAELLAASGSSAKDATSEIEHTVRRCFWYAAQADKYDGAIHGTKSKHITLAMPEAWGVVAIVCPDEMPLLSMMSLILPAVAIGNRVVVIASQAHPLVASRLYQVLETSDMPAGVINLISGERDVLAKTLAEHDGVDALWYCGNSQGIRMVEEASASNLKTVWTDGGNECNWHDDTAGQGREFLRRATQIKTIWLPYGE